MLHPPYTAWHLSYVAIGAAVAPRVHGGRTAVTVLAFFLAVGIAAHAFDELHDRPLGTRFRDRALAIAGGLALAAAVGIGVVGTVTVSATLAPLVVFGAAICLAYNLELFGGRFHSDLWFALAWGVFPAVTGYWVNALRFSVAGALVALSCGALSVAQRRLQHAGPVAAEKDNRGQRSAAAGRRLVGGALAACPAGSAGRSAAGAVGGAPTPGRRPARLPTLRATVS